ncbi:MAG: succinylglutamate-semialdehyde dehydrogenase [Actinomycetota bacterium]
MTGLLAGGEWVTGGGEPFRSVDPCTGATAWSGRAASAADVDRAVAAARAAFPAWSRRGAGERAEILRAFATLLEGDGAEIREWISRETGKPRWEARAEVALMAAKVGISIEAQAVRAAEFAAGPAVTRFRPHGVVAVIGPFNYPGHLPNGHIVPALLAGNTVVFKPSELAPGVAEATGRAWRAAGLPPGVLNIVQGARETGEAVTRHDGVDGLFLTGSARTGVAIHRMLAGRPDRILALEMGGNNPLVVHDVADVRAAAYVTVQSAYLTAGQRCSCARRLIVTGGAGGDAFLDALVAAIGGITVGCPGDAPEPFMGPVITAAAAEGLLRAQADLVARGGRCLVEMRSLAAGTGLLSPGLVDVTAVADRADEELFGPLLQVIRVPDVDAAIAEANATRFGLAAGLLSDDPGLYRRFREEVRAGVVNWNQQLTGASSRAPFGGVGLSGNHHPSAYFAADYCAYPVASMERPAVAIPDALPPGLAPPP